MELQCGAKKPHPAKPDGAARVQGAVGRAYSANGNVVWPSARMPKTLSVIATSA